VTESAPPSQTVSKRVASSEGQGCIRCAVLRAKSRLPLDGDWLFASFRSCSQHAAAASGETDLSAAFDTVEDASRAIRDVVSSEGRSRMYAHAQECVASSQGFQGIVRQKAISLLTAATFTMAVMAASIGILERALRFRTWLWLLLAAIASLGLCHFMRALILSLQAITRETTTIVPTQQVAKIASAPEPQHQDGSVDLSLAAELLSAAAVTHKQALRSVNEVILAQTSFRYGLAVLLLFFLTYATALRLTSAPVDPGWLREAQTLSAQYSEESRKLESLSERLAEAAQRLTDEHDISEKDMHALRQRVDELERDATQRNEKSPSPRR
jgi:hypothetical protein